MANMVPLGACCALLDFDVDRVIPIVAERLPERHQNLVPINRSVLQHAWEAAHDILGDKGFFPDAASPVRISRPEDACRGTRGYWYRQAARRLRVSDLLPNRSRLRRERLPGGAAGRLADRGAAGGGRGRIHEHGRGRGARRRSRGHVDGRVPGFTLMAEGMGFASITEAPGPVVVLYQRGGPSTGLPTRNSQQDLRFALQPAHGEFPPHCGGARRCRRGGAIHPSGLQLGRPLPGAGGGAGRQVHRQLALHGRQPRSQKDCRWTAAPIWTGDANGAEPYRRHQLTASGVSPRSVPGTPGGEFVTTSDEHTERGRIEEDIDNRIDQMDKRHGQA